ncbi:hypothetical protein HDU76_007510, partial [Blyttiomyces sp. JEL0837]
MKSMGPRHLKVDMSRTTPPAINIFNVLYHKRSWRYSWRPSFALLLLSIGCIMLGLTLGVNAGGVGGVQMPHQNPQQQPGQSSIPLQPANSPPPEQQQIDSTTILPTAMPFDQSATTASQPTLSTDPRQLHHHTSSPEKPKTTSISTTNLTNVKTTRIVHAKCPSVCLRNASQPLVIIPTVPLTVVWAAEVPIDNNNSTATTETDRRKPLNRPNGLGFNSLHRRNHHNRKHESSYENQGITTDPMTPEDLALDIVTLEIVSAKEPYACSPDSNVTTVMSDNTTLTYFSHNNSIWSRAFVNNGKANLRLPFSVVQKRNITINDTFYVRLIAKDGCKFGLNGLKIGHLNVTLPTARVEASKPPMIFVGLVVVGIALVLAGWVAYILYKRFQIKRTIQEAEHPSNRSWSHQGPQWASGKQYKVWPFMQGRGNRDNT